MKMFNLSAESFPDDSILANLSSNHMLTPNRSNTSASIKLLETHPLISDSLKSIELSCVPSASTPVPTISVVHNDLSAPPTSKPTSSSSVLPPEVSKKSPRADDETTTKTYTKSLNNAQNRRIGGPFKRSALPLSKKSASVDSLLHPPISVATKTITGGSLKRLTQRGYEHIQSKVKADIDSAREHDNRRRSKFQRHQSMPETICPPPPGKDVENRSSEELPPDSTMLVNKLRDQVQVKDRLIAEKDLLIMQLNSVYQSSDLENQEKENLRLQRKIEAMRMEIMEVNKQNQQYLDEVRELTSKVSSAGGSNSAAPSSAGSSYPTSGVHTNSSAGSSYRKHISYSSSSGVSSASTAFLSDDQFLLHRKPKKPHHDDNGAVSPGAMMLDGDDGIVLFDKSQIDVDCPIITSSSTSNEILELFNEVDGANEGITGKRAKRRRRANAKSIRKRLRRLITFCTPCLDHNGGESSGDLDGDTSLLYTELDRNGVSNSRYNSFM